jgi:hypothetical protein
MKFRNTRRGPYVVPQKTARRDDELIFEPLVIASGQSAKLDPESPSVRMHALAGILEPDDAESRKALAEWQKAAC